MHNELLFILPTYNHFDYVRACFESFVRNTPQGIYHIAVIDDASPDWLEREITGWFPSIPACYCHYQQQDGLTRSWNTGLRIARDGAFKYTVVGNSDLLFTENWYQPLKEAVDAGFDLVGPITNAPGHAPWQSVQTYCGVRATDDRTYLNDVARSVGGYYLPDKAIPCQFVNGFCMLAKTQTWWNNAFDAENVFNPKFKLTGNEDELQARWRGKGKKFGFVPKSFVFHYRSVSRPDALKHPSSKGAYRNESPSRDDRVRPEEHCKLVDAGVEKCGEVQGCQTSSSPQL